MLFPQLLATAVEAAPGGIAVVDGDRHVTYSDLDEASSRIARALIARGLGPENRIAVGIPRSIESVLAIWAVVKSGAAYVPIDPDYPADRLAHMIGDSGVDLGLTVRAARQALRGGVEWLALDDTSFVAECSWHDPAPVSYADRVRPLRAEHPAYVIYTSGSTGLPKGVVVTHAGLANFCAEQRDRYRLTASARTLHYASPSFDASVLELLLALAAGATMVIVPPRIYGGRELAALLRERRVTHMFATPAALASVDPTGLTDLRVVVSGGEACPPELVNRWAAAVSDADDREFYNGYGPTETTIMTNISAPLHVGEPVTIGAAIRNTTAHVLDSRLRPVPVGVVGEVYLAGPGLARGYLGRPGLTAERFVADPTGSGTRLYRTGDVVRSRASGAIEFVGRNDFQVKIRGFRIELGEIDAAFTAHADVALATTVGHRTAAGTTVLVTYVQPADDRRIDTTALLEFVAKTLPAHMVPAAAVTLDRIPLTPVGKIDRAALPAPEFGAGEYVRPANAREALVADVFATVLAVPRAGRDDDFFALGGNSLVATRVAARLGEAFGSHVPARVVFENPTVRGLALALQSGGTERARPALVAAPRAARPPLSYAQQRYWFLNQFDTSSAVDNIPFAVRLSGALDAAALQAAFGDVVARHETLRTWYPTDGEGPYQVILPAADVRLDLTPIPVDSADLDSRLGRLAAHGFDVTADVPLQVRLFTLTPDEHALAVVVHHIAADGSSMVPFARDLAASYAARAAGVLPDLPPLEVHYTDYARWQRELLGSGDDPDSLAAEQIRYWREQLRAVPDQLDLPGDRPRPAVQSFRGAAIGITLDADLHRELTVLARTSGTSLFMVMHAALAVLLTRLTDVDDIVVGTPIAGRGERALDDMIGMFVNTLLLRTRIRPGEPFEELLARTRETDLQAFAHADVPFERLVEELNPPRSVARNPLFQVGFSFQNMATALPELPGIAVSAVGVAASLAKTDLQVSVSDSYSATGEPVALTAEFSYATDLFDAGTVAAWAERYERILRAAVAAPSTVVGDIDILDPAERTALLTQWNRVDSPAPRRETLADLLDAQVAATPDATALLVDGPDGEVIPITYREFDADVNRLARHLVSLGIGPESLVALAIERSAALVVAMYAVVKAGGGYVPLDPDHPAAHTANVLAASAPAVVLTTGARRFPLPAQSRTVDVDAVDLSGYSAAPLRDADRVAPLHPSATAYVIFTSGSTGRPKGVSVDHLAVVNQLAWKRDTFALGPSDTALLRTSATFDLSVWEFWSPLVSGARLAIASPGRQGDPAYVNSLIERAQVTTLHAVPSLLDALLTADDGRLSPSLRRVLVIGETLAATTAQRFRATNAAEVVNLYGPTEAAVSVTAHVVGEGDRDGVPIGRPEWNVEVYVLDSRLHPVPAGVPGELYLGGVQLARGYRGAPGLTAERFVAHPFADSGERLYRTGDLVSWNADGELEYLCRTDFQVKVRGFRIELGAIEAALLRQDDVAAAAVVAHSDSRVGERLVGYVVPTPGATVDHTSLSTTLARELPSYMVPSTSVVLKELPRSATGKLDVRALPAPVVQVSEFRAPRTELERTVAEVYGAVLARDDVGLDDDFFALGGHSLLAARAVALLAHELDTTVAMPWIFTHPTVEQLANRIASADAPADTDAALAPIVELAPGAGGVPLFCIHPISGLGWSYRTLGAHLDASVPLYAVQTPAILDAEFTVASIDALADRYVAEIRRVRPSGPYHLLGWSLGGLLAHAVAVRLRGEVESLTIVDAVPSIDPVLVRAELGRFLRDAGVDEPVESLSDAGAERAATGFGVEVAQLTGTRVRRMIAAALAAADAAADYVPAGYDGDVLYCAATGSTADADAWRGYVGRLEVRTFQGSHAELFEPAVVATLGPAVARWLEYSRGRV